MLSVSIGLLLIVTVAAGIVAVVAAPRLRGGEEILTPDGKQSLRRARRQAREQSAAAAGTTAAKVSSLRSRSSSIWAPLSEFLHRQFDRLEAHAPSAPAQPAGRTALGQQAGKQAQPGTAVLEGEPRHVGRYGDPGVQAVPRLLPLDPADAEPRVDIDDLDDDWDDADHADHAEHTEDADGEELAPVRAATVGAPRPVPPESGPIPEVEAGVARAQRQPGPDVPAVINLRDLEASQAAPHASPDVTTRRRT